MTIPGHSRMFRSHTTLSPFMLAVLGCLERERFIVAHTGRVRVLGLA